MEAAQVTLINFIMFIMVLTYLNINFFLLDCHCSLIAVKN